MKELESKTHYEILGVMPDASKEEIKERYREIARAYHPDSNFYAEIIDDTLSGEHLDVFKKITEAYNTLINDDRRREYDDAYICRLKSWDEEETFRAEELKPKSSSSYAYGIFGSVQAQSSFDHVTRNRHRSVSEEIKRQRGLFSRVLNFFSF